MIQLDAFHTLKVVAEEPFGMRLADGSIVLPRRHVPPACALGDLVDVFVYADPEGRSVATTKKPAAMPGDFALLTAVDRIAHGVFVDWGLEKDLFVPNHEQLVEMKVGRAYLLAITLDPQGRVMASARINNFLDLDSQELHEGEKVTYMVYEQHERGLKVIVNKRYAGMIYHDEIYQELHIGDHGSATISCLREDGKIDLRLRRQGPMARLEHKEHVWIALERAGGTLQLHDKSAPEEIKKQLHMSKKAFKRSVGLLMKAGLIDMDDQHIWTLSIPER